MKNKNLKKVFPQKIYDEFLKNVRSAFKDAPNVIAEAEVVGPDVIAGHFSLALYKLSESGSPVIGLLLTAYEKNGILSVSKKGVTEEPQGGNSYSIDDILRVAVKKMNIKTLKILHDFYRGYNLAAPEIFLKNISEFGKNKEDIDILEVLYEWYKDRKILNPQSFISIVSVKWEDLEALHALLEFYERKQLFNTMQGGLVDVIVYFMRNKKPEALEVLLGFYGRHPLFHGKSGEEDLRKLSKWVYDLFAEHHELEGSRLLDFCLQNKLLSEMSGEDFGRILSVCIRRSQLDTVKKLLDFCQQDSSLLKKVPVSRLHVPLWEFMANSKFDVTMLKALLDLYERDGLISKLFTDDASGLAQVLTFAAEKKSLPVLQFIFDFYKKHNFLQKISAGGQFGLGHILYEAVKSGSLEKVKFILAFYGENKLFDKITVGGKYGLTQVLLVAGNNIEFLLDSYKEHNFVDKIPGVGEGGLGHVLLSNVIDPKRQISVDSLFALYRKNKFFDKIPADGEYGLGHILQITVRQNISTLLAVLAMYQKSGLLDRLPMTGEYSLGNILSEVISKNDINRTVILLRFYKENNLLQKIPDIPVPYSLMASTGYLCCYYMQYSAIPEAWRDMALECAFAAGEFRIIEEAISVDLQACVGPLTRVKKEQIACPNIWYAQFHPLYTSILQQLEEQERALKEEVELAKNEKTYSQNLGIPEKTKLSSREVKLYLKDRQERQLNLLQVKHSDAGLSMVQDQIKKLKEKQKEILSWFKKVDDLSQEKTEIAQILSEERGERYITYEERQKEVSACLGVDVKYLGERKSNPHTEKVISQKIHAILGNPKHPDYRKIFDWYQMYQNPKLRENYVDRLLEPENRDETLKLMQNTADMDQRVFDLLWVWRLGKRHPLQLREEGRAEEKQLWHLKRAFDAIPKDQLLGGMATVLEHFSKALSITKLQDGSYSLDFANEDVAEALGTVLTKQQVAESEVSGCIVILKANKGNTAIVNTLDTFIANTSKLQEAVKKRDYPQCRVLLEAGRCFPSVRDPETSGSLLQQVLLEKIPDYTLVLMLLPCTDLTARDRGKETVLDILVKKYKPVPEEAGKVLEKCLLDAAREGDGKLTGEITRHAAVCKINLNVTDPETGNTAAHYAVLNNNPEMFGQLLLAGANMEVRNENKNTVRDELDILSDGDNFIKSFEDTSYTPKFEEWLDRENTPPKKKIRTDQPGQSYLF